MPAMELLNPIHQTLTAMALKNICYPMMLI
jgi:hypothetical protein